MTDYQSSDGVDLFLIPTALSVYVFVETEKDTYSV